MNCKNCYKKTAIFFKIPFSKFNNIHICKNFSFIFQGGGGGVLKCINRSFFNSLSVSVESGPITAPYSQCQFVDHSNSVDQTD